MDGIPPQPCQLVLRLLLLFVQWPTVISKSVVIAWRFGIVLMGSQNFKYKLNRSTRWQQSEYNWSMLLLFFRVVQMTKFSVLTLALAFNRRVRNSTSLIKNTSTRTKKNTEYELRSSKLCFMHEFTNTLNFSLHLL